MAMTIRARFAPSPTGLLHIGSARTALFNYLFARHHGGEFLLRIEDTDRERSTDAATKVILEGLAWLGITPDQQPVFQSTRSGRHAEVARQMLASGHAYNCYCTAEELRQMREQAVAEGRSPRYDGRWRDREPADAPPGIAPAIRLKAPREGETVVEDLVQGTVRVGNTELDDMIILRSDGSPTYNHSVVVDDHDMGITHVIRGDDHLTNTFREQGYLPEALCNYLLRLGWGHGDVEVLDRDEAIRLFDLDGVGRAPSRMDYAKLDHVNGVYIRQADDDRLTREVLERLAHRTDLALGAKAADRIRALIPALKQRAKTLVELADAASFLAHPLPLPMEPKAAALLTPEARLMLREVTVALAGTDFTPPAIDAALRSFADASGRKLGQVAQPLRAALTGSTASPGIDLTLAALGKEEALARLHAVA